MLLNPSWKRLIWTKCWRSFDPVRWKCICSSIRNSGFSYLIPKFCYGAPLSSSICQDDLCCGVTTYLCSGASRSLLTLAMLPAVACCLLPAVAEASYAISIFQQKGLTDQTVVASAVICLLSAGETSSRVDTEKVLLKKESNSACYVKKNIILKWDMDRIV